MTATTAPTVARPTSIGAVVNDTFVMLQRPMLRYKRDPQTAIFLFIQPIMFTLLFVYVFGGSIEVPGMSYVSFLVPGIIVQTIAFNTSGTTVAIAEDLQKGIVDRLRSLPISGLSVIAGRVLADTIITIATTIFMAGIGYVVGFRITAGLTAAVAALAIIAYFGFAFSWIAAYLGTKVGSVEAAQSAGFIWLFPVTFVSSVFVRAETLPGPMEAFANANPITLIVDVARGLTVGGPVADSLPGALLWLTGISVTFMALSLRSWKRLG